MLDMRDLDAVAMAAMVRKGEVSAAELVSTAIERAERVNPTLNAIVAERFEAARAEAAAFQPGEQPLAGVPILLKDLFCPSAGDSAPQGNRLMRELNVRYDHSGAVARRLHDAGTLSLGRSHSPELGCGNCPASAETATFGSARNPWDPGRTPMGSSGGAAAAVAAGVVAIAHASDGGGSIRIPASACGIVGLKPSRGRVSAAPAGEAWGGGVTDGVVSRTVRDTALALDVLAGAETGDPYTAPPFQGSYLDEVGADPGRARIGVCAGLSYVETAPECSAAALAAAHLLEQLGHHVDEDHLPALAGLDYMYDYIRVIRVSTAVALRSLEPAIGRRWAEDDVENGTWVNYQRGLKVAAGDYVASLDRLHRWTRQLVAWWDEGHDLLVTPTLATLPPAVGYLVEPDERERTRRLAAVVPYTPQFNVSGQPAVSLPLGWSADGLPIGVQLVAAPGREDLLVRVAAQLEEVAPWAGRRPRVSA
jgi:amidase